MNAAVTLATAEDNDDARHDTTAEALLSVAGAVRRLRPQQRGARRRVHPGPRRKPGPDRRIRAPGKSTIAKAILRLLPHGQATVGGSVRLDGRDVLALPETEFRPLRGRSLGYIPQDPGSALNPVRTIGAQAQEAAALLGSRRTPNAGGRILAFSSRWACRTRRRVYESYPHQLSGGMLQRVLIALTVLPRPALIVADEPTSALDVTVQKLILDMLAGLRRELDISLLLITHDLAIAAERADSLVVLKDGAVQEAGPRGRCSPPRATEYARSLQADVPALNPDRYRSQRLAALPPLAGGCRIPAAPQIEVRGRAPSATPPAARKPRRGRGVASRWNAGRRTPWWASPAPARPRRCGCCSALNSPTAAASPSAASPPMDARGPALRDDPPPPAAGLPEPVHVPGPHAGAWAGSSREPLDRFRVGDKADRAGRVRRGAGSPWACRRTFLSRRPAAALRRAAPARGHRPRPGGAARTSWCWTNRRPPWTSACRPASSNCSPGCSATWA